MNRVKINDIFNMCYVERPRVADIEVVPRKMVEMIIKKCKDHASGPRPSDYIVGVSDEAGVIAKYAESLLKQFEEDAE